MNKLKLIFLDCDGVLNNEKVLREHRSRPGMSLDLSAICPKRIKLLGRILDATGARLVLSSSWRLEGLYGAAPTLRLLREEGLDPRHEWYGVTGDFDNWTDEEQQAWRTRYPRKAGYFNERVAEIQDYLDRHDGPIESFCILDDLGSFRHLERYQIRTTSHHGLLEEHVDRAIKILGGTTNV